MQPIRVEKVGSFLAVSPAAAVRWEAKRLDRRLEEAERIARRQAARRQAADSVENQARRVESQLARLQESGQTEAATDASDDVAATLDVHESLLTALTNNDSSDETGAAIVRSVQAHKQTVTQAVKTTPSGSPSAQATAGKATAAQQKIDEVKRWLDKWRARLDPAVTAAAVSQPTKAQATFDHGRTQAAAGDSAEAFRLFQQALRQAQASQSFLTSHQDRRRQEATSTPPKQKQETNQSAEGRSNSGEDSRSIASDHRAENENSSTTTER